MGNKSFSFHNILEKNVYILDSLHEVQYFRPFFEIQK